MKRSSIFLMILVAAGLAISSCSHGISIQEAANGKAKCGRNHLK